MVGVEILRAWRGPRRVRCFDDRIDRIQKQMLRRRLKTKGVKNS
jgi:DNA-binding HxlR family transcriptional regulator